MMRVLSWSIASPVLDSDVVAHAKAAAREEALVFTDARMQTLVSCARQVETYVGRALWPGTRAALSIVEVNDPYETVSLVPGLPNTAGVTLGVPAIREWSDTLGDWQAVMVTRRPAGMVRLPRSGEFEIAVEVAAAATIPPEAIEAVARLWGYRDVLKPGDLTEVTGEQQVLAGGMMKSGAAECLRPIRHAVI